VENWGSLPVETTVTNHEASADDLCHPSPRSIGGLISLSFPHQQPVLQHAAAYNAVAKSTSEWIMDTGASRHMTWDRSAFASFERLSKPLTVGVADGKALLCEYTGVVPLLVRLPADAGGGTQQIFLKNVLYVPELRRNLFSVSTALAQGMKLIGSAASLEIKSSAGRFLCYGSPVGSGVTGKLFMLQI
jgi:hypothetical protein